MKSFDMARLFNVLHVPGPDLLLREDGAKVFPILEEALAVVPEGSALVLEFAKIRIMDTSFAGSTVIKLLAGLVDGQYGDRFLILDSLKPPTIENLEGALARRKQKIGALVRGEKGVEVIGHLEPNLSEAWALALQVGTLTARDLADKLNLEISTASMRLHKLYKARLLARHEEIIASGRQHVYALPT
jgi:hypothetical protein